MARAAMTTIVCRAIAVYRRTWDRSSPEQSLPNSKLLRPVSAAPWRGSAWHGSEAVLRPGSGSRRRVRRWSGGGGSAGDAARRRSYHARHTSVVASIPSRRSGFPAAAAAQPGGGLFAGERDRRAASAGSWRGPAARRPSRGLRRTRAVRCMSRTLHRRTRSQPHAVGEGLGEDVDGQLAFGAEDQLRRQAHDPGFHGIIDVLAGTHSRAPISACPACSRTYARCTVLIPLASLPAQPRYWRLTPAVRVPCLACPVSSIAPTASPRRRPVLRLPRPARPRRTGVPPPSPRRCPRRRG